MPKPEFKVLGVRVAVVVAATFVLHFALLALSVLVGRCWAACFGSARAKNSTGPDPADRDTTSDSSVASREPLLGNRRVPESPPRSVPRQNPDAAGGAGAGEPPALTPEYLGDGFVLSSFVDGQPKHRERSQSGHSNHRDPQHHGGSSGSTRPERQDSMNMSTDPLAAAHDTADQDVWDPADHAVFLRSTQEWQERSIWRELLHCFVAALLVTMSLAACLFSNMCRRLFTDASKFDLVQMWWHSLTSFVDIVSVLVITKLFTKLHWKDIGWRFTSHDNHFSFWGRIREYAHNNMRRVTIATLVAGGTHCITPAVYYGLGCWGGWTVVKYEESDLYKAQGWVGVACFFATQQFCFYINALDEETNWRGFMNGVWCQYRLPLAPLFISTGWNYAMVHSLNVTVLLDDMTSIGAFSVMVFNMTCEGALWMMLYRCSKDLWGNVWLHDIDDLFSIWFGGTALAGYGLPAGQLMPFIVTKCAWPWYVTGGDFGDGSGFVYVVQNFYTLCVIVLLELAYFQWQHHSRCEQCGWHMWELKAIRS